MTKSTARNIILFLLSLVIAFSTQISRLSFDYNFENLFSTENEDLTFYNDYRKIYGNDNDYILIAFQPQSGVFDSTFLTKFELLESNINVLHGVTSTISPLSLGYVYKTPMGYTPIKYLRIKNNEDLAEDSIRILRSPELLESLFNTDLTDIVLVIKHSPLDDAASKKLVNKIENAIARNGIGEYHLAGKAKAQTEFVTFIQQDFGTFLGIGTLLIIIVLWMMFRSVIIVFASLAITICVLIFTFGIMGVAGVPIDVMAALIPLLLIIVSISDLIHFLTKYKQEINEGREVSLALKNTWKDVGLATFLTSATTAIGFFTLLTAKSIPIGNMGLYTGIGVLAAFIFTILLLSSLLTIFPETIVATKDKEPIQLFSDQLLVQLFNKRLPVIGGFIMLALISLWGVSKIDINAKLIDDLPNGSKIKNSFIYFDNEIGGSKPWELSLKLADTSKNNFYSWEVLQQISLLEKYLIDEYGVIALQSPLTHVRLFNKALTGKYALPDSTVYGSWPNAWHIFGERNHEDQVLRLDGSAGRMTGFVKDFGSKLSIEKDEHLETFISEQLNVDLLNIRLTGTTYLIDRSHHIISINLLYGLLLAVVAVALIAGMVFRNVWLVAVTLICNMLPVLLIGGTLGFFGISLSLANSIIFVVSFGIAVDDTLHFVSRYRMELKKNVTHKTAIIQAMHTTGKAIISTTLVLMAGFFLLLFSAFNTTFSIGLLISLTLLYALLVDLILLPVLLSIPYSVNSKD
jgi:predicted RND superfamily exporter protein